MATHIIHVVTSMAREYSLVDPTTDLHISSAQIP